MPVQFHQLVEVPCAFEAPAPESVIALAEANHPDAAPFDPVQAKRCAQTCASDLHPRGTYRLYNPAICTLPPKYTEPGIKLVGTMAVLRGEEAYNRMSKAEHCAVVAATPGTALQASALLKRFAGTPQGNALLESCLQIAADAALEAVLTRLNEEAQGLGLLTDDILVPGSLGFPLSMNSQIFFYTQAEGRLGMRCTEDGSVYPRQAFIGVVGLYKSTGKSRKRACARCTNARHCSIRAIGMNCHGRKGSFS